MFWTVLKYMSDYLCVCSLLKKLPMEKLPLFNHDLGNFGYTVLLTLSVMTLREKLLKFMNSIIFERHIGEEEVPLTDPFRVMKIRVKREVAVVYDAMISSDSIKRN